MLPRLAYLVFTLLFLQGAAADVIHLTDGRVFHGEVTEYRDGVVRFSSIEDDDDFVALTLVERIEFDSPAQLDDQTLIIPPAPAYEAELQALVEQAKERLEEKAASSAAVVMYLEAEMGGPPVPEEEVEYRCYRGGGYSGIQQVPVGTPWVHFENVTQQYGGTRRIQIDPGPPYAIINRNVTLVPGEVANLGRIILRRVRAKGTVSLSGYIRDGAGTGVENVLVSAGARRTHTDDQGFYKLDGFGLEVVSLSARKKGFVSGGSRVSIRDTQKAEIACDIGLFRPRRLKLSYVISAEGSNSFEGPGIEAGVIERVIDSPRISLDETIYASKSFQRFAKDTRLYLRVNGGEATIDNSYAPIFYQSAEAEVGFEDIKEIGTIRMGAQRCPPLTEGSIIVVRGYQPESKRGVSQFCVKFLVEEFSTAAAEFDEQEFTPVEDD